MIHKERPELLAVNFFFAYQPRRAVADGRDVTHISSYLKLLQNRIPSRNSTRCVNQHSMANKVRIMA